MKRIAIIYFSILLSLLFIGIIFGTLITNFYKTSDVKPGQVWVWESSQNDNPFKKSRIDTMRVIDVKNNYVLYVVKNDTFSENIRLFRVGSRLIK